MILLVNQISGEVWNKKATNQPVRIQKIREGKYLELDEVGERNKRTKELQTYFDDLVRDLQDEMMQVQKLRSSLRFFYRSHGFTLDPKAVQYFIPPNNSDYIVNIDQTLASRAFFQQVRKKDASLILQEEGEKDVYRTYPVGIRSDDLSDELTYYMRRRQILRYRKKNEGKGFNQFVEFTFNKGKSKNSNGISDEKKEVYNDIWDSIRDVDAELKRYNRKDG